MSDYRELSKCLCCDSDDLRLLLNLNNQPLANSYHKEDEVLDEYPLGVNICNKFGICQYNYFRVHSNHANKPMAVRVVCTDNSTIQLLF